MIKVSIYQEYIMINIYAPKQRPKAREAESDRLEERNRQINNKVGVFGIPFSIMNKATRQKTNTEVNKKLEQQCKTARPKRHLQNTPHNSRIHILLECTYNTLQDRLHVRPYRKSQ